MAKKYVYYFGSGKAEGKAQMKELLGGKGANLAEMCLIGLPVPAGFTVTTECCVDYFKAAANMPESLDAEVKAALKKVERDMGMGFGDPKNPLLISCRSGARSSMPGMMETVLNVGLSSKTIPGMIKKTGNARFVYDAYRRLIMMYADVVMEKAEGIEPAEGKGIRKQLDEMLGDYKKKKGYKLDTDLTADDLQKLVEAFKKKVKQVLKKDFPDDPWKQLWGGIGAVFKSWNGKRAISYRRIENIPDDWGTAVNVQSMVFGNMGDSSATGVAFTRNPATGENKFYGEWLVNAQGEDVVAGIRTPNPLNNETKNDQNKHLPSLQQAMPAIYKQLMGFRARLEKHYSDMQDIEFTIQEGRLYMLQCRGGKRTGTAALNMAMDMLAEKLIDEKTVIGRVEPAHLDQLLHPFVDPAAEKKAKVITRGLPAGPGGATGHIVFTSEEAVKMNKQGKKVILVREETNPEDVEGMRAAQGVLTARGGMTSHAALVARGWGKCCIVGAGEMHASVSAKKMTVKGVTFKEGDWITLNGTLGVVYQGQLPDDRRLGKSPLSRSSCRSLTSTAPWACAPMPIRRLMPKSPAPSAPKASACSAPSICSTASGAEKPLFLLRKMILSSTEAERRKALNELSVFVKRDIKNTMSAMEGLPVTIRLLDPPLHEFVPQSADKQAELAKALKIKAEDVRKRGEALHESNPMMGHRGVRLGVTFPEVTEMQVRAILEAAAELNKAKKEVQA